MSSYTAYQYLEHLLVARSGPRALYLPTYLHVMVPDTPGVNAHAKAKALGFAAIRVIQMSFDRIVKQTAMTDTRATQFIHTADVSLAYQFIEDAQQYSVLGLQSLSKAVEVKSGEDSQVELLAVSTEQDENLNRTSSDPGASNANIVSTSTTSETIPNDDDSKERSKSSQSGSSTSSSSTSKTLPPGTYLSRMSLVAQTLHVRIYPPNTSLLHLADKGWILDSTRSDT